MNQTEIVKQERKQVAELFNSECCVCLKEFGKSFHFHHIGYREGEKKYKDFKDHSSQQQNWIDYTKYILPIIRKYPKEFALLCQKHHKFVEMLIKLKDDKFEKLIELATRSRK